MTHLLDKNWLYEHYITKRMSCVSIAKMLDCHVKTVRNKLKVYGIRTRIGGEGKSTKREGMRTGMLTVIRWYKKGIWLCDCDCGKTGIEVTTHNLNRWKSCGCQANQPGKKNATYKGYKELSGTLVARIKNKARTRGIFFDTELLTSEYLYKLLEKQDFKCSLSGLEISINDRTASLDRIDSSQGYVAENIQWVHRDVNQMKWQFSEDRFIEMCGRIFNFNRNGV